MTARQSGSFPLCRLTSEDADKLADIFEGMSSHSRSEDNPIFRFETLSGTFTYDTFTAQSRRWSQREVTAIEIVAKGNSVWARLCLGLEEGGKIVYPTGQNASDVRSKLEVEVCRNTCGVSSIGAARCWPGVTLLAQHATETVATQPRSGLPG